MRSNSRLTSVAARSLRLRDSQPVIVRPLRDGDRVRIERFVATLSQESLSARFFGWTDPARAARTLSEVADGDLCLLVQGPHRAVIAHAGLYRLGATSADIAFLVADAWQGRGIAQLLLALLIETARELELRTLVADLLARNRAMLAVFERCGEQLELRDDGDSLRVRMRIEHGDALPRAA